MRKIVVRSTIGYEPSSSEQSLIPLQGLHRPLPGRGGIVANPDVKSRTGWFSDHSVCYLAAGRPVIVKDTGIRKYLPTGLGPLTFTDIEGAAGSMDVVENDYDRHAATAAGFAREFLDFERIIALPPVACRAMTRHSFCCRPPGLHTRSC